MAAAAVQQPAMASNLGHTGIPSSLAARRPAANNLPSVDLPPLPFPQHRTIPFPINNGTHQGLGNLLTPPSNLPGDNVSPISSVLNSANANGQGIPPFHSGYSYLPPPPPTGTTPLGMTGGTGTTPQPWSQSVRGLFSPSLLGSLPRNNSNSPSTTEGLPPPPYDMNQLPPFSAASFATSSAMTAPSSLAASLPAMVAQQHTVNQGFMQQNQAQTPNSVSTSQASPVHGSDSYVQRPQSNPSNFYPASQPSSAQQSSFPPFNGLSPTQQSPMSAPPMTAPPRLSPIHGQNVNYPSAGSQFGYRQYNPYPLPGMNAPMQGTQLQMPGSIMTNMHDPGNRMAMMNLGLPPGMMAGFHSGQAAQMYGAPNQVPNSDRPFKCDQCPQSFNRNHDLKRHKRIHLAVKPFPCGHCDKSFSRKDALKRHILVKGCGKKRPEDKKDKRSSSPDIKEGSSDSDETMAPNISRHSRNASD